MPRGGLAARGPSAGVGVLRSAAHRRAESRFWGGFLIAAHRAFVLGLGGAAVEAYIGFYPPLHSAPTSEVPGHPYVHLAERRDSPLGHPTDGAHL